MRSFDVSLDGNSLRKKDSGLCMVGVPFRRSTDVSEHFPTVQDEPFYLTPGASLCANA